MTYDFMKLRLNFEYDRNHQESNVEYNPGKYDIDIQRIMVE